MTIISSAEDTTTSESLVPENHGNSTTFGFATVASSFINGQILICSRRVEAQPALVISGSSRTPRQKLSVVR